LYFLSYKVKYFANKQNYIKIEVALKIICFLQNKIIVFRKIIYNSIKFKVKKIISTNKKLLFKTYYKSFKIIYNNSKLRAKINFSAVFLRPIFN